MVGDRNIQKNRSQVLKRFTPMASRWEFCTLSIEPSYKIVLSLKGAIQWELCIGSLHLPPDTWFHKPVDSGVNSSLCQWSATHSFSWSWSLADQYTAKSTYAMLCHGWTRAAMFFLKGETTPASTSIDAYDLFILFIGKYSNTKFVDHIKSPHELIT